MNDLVQRVERLLERHEDLQRTHAHLQAELAQVTQERDSLKSRLAAARHRIDTLVQRLPLDGTPGAGA